MPDYEEPTFIEEPVPPLARGTRASFPWEEKLAAIKKVPKGEHRRVYTFDTKPKAMARANAIKKRWLEAVPLERVSTVVRQIDSGDWGLYLAHHGGITQDERDELTAKTAARSAQTIASRSKNAEAAQSPAQPSKSPAARLAAAKAAKAS